MRSPSSCASASRSSELSEPGLHFHWWPIETVEIANIAEKLIDIGGGSRDPGNSGLMLSGDQNIVDVQFSVAYQVSDPSAYLFNVVRSRRHGAPGRRKRDARSRSAAARRRTSSATTGRASPTRCARSSRPRSTSYGPGSPINAISIEDAAPPREVADAFDEVQRAEQDEDRFVEEANQYSNQKLGQARGQAAQVREEAAAYKNRVVAGGRGRGAALHLGLQRIRQGARRDAQAAVSGDHGKGPEGLATR